MKKYLRIEFILTLIVLLCVIWFTLLYRMDANPVYLYDESRLAVNAFEMTQTGNWLVTTYDRSPDMWNVKPPLMIIFQALSMKLLGYNELAVRLPTAIAALATLFLLLWFSITQLNSPLTGFCAAVFLCTSAGYVREHVARTGDYDTLLIFFLTAYFLFAYLFLKTGRYPYYLWFCACLFLALFTKGIGGAFFLPGTVLMIMLDPGARKKVFSIKYFLPLLAVGLFISGYYVIREIGGPGYIQTVLFEEVGGRMFNEKFDLDRPWYFYFRQLVTNDFNPWWVLLPLSIPIYFKCTRDEKILISAIGFTVAIFWIPLTLSVNKNFWYSAPSFPLLSLVSAITFAKICSYCFENFGNSLTKKTALICSIALITIFPANESYIRATKLNDQIGLVDLIKSNRVTSDTKIISNGYNSQLNFYQKILNAKGINVQSIPTDQIQNGDLVLVSSSNESGDIKQKFQYEVLYRLKETEMLIIK